jgi:hypothetical protein
MPDCARLLPKSFVGRPAKQKLAGGPAISIDLSDIHLRKIIELLPFMIRRIIFSNHTSMKRNLLM